jgi:branched-chain amino acid transport system permease protein
MNKFKSLNKTTRANIITFAMVVIAYGVMQALSSAGAISNSMVGLLVPICSYICMAISLTTT